MQVNVLVRCLINVFRFQTKIKDFKEQIAAEVNVPAGNQRLIFHGRVLQDDFLLTQGEIQFVML